MGPPSFMRSVVDRNVVMRRIPVLPSASCPAVPYFSYTQYDLVRKPSTLDALIGYFTPSHVIHQRLLLQFLSAPEDGRKKRPKHVEYYCSY